MKEIICVPKQQHLTSFSETALDGAVGHLGTPVWSTDDKLLRIHIHWDFLDAPQSAKIIRF
jgi:hypothetical protein